MTAEIELPDEDLVTDEELITGLALKADKTDSRLSDERVPQNGSVTADKLAVDFQLARAKLDGSSRASLGKADTAPQVDPVTGLLPSSIVPIQSLISWKKVTNEAGMLASGTTPGSGVIRDDTGTGWVLTENGNPTVLADWAELSAEASVISVNGRVGNITGLAESSDPRFTDTRVPIDGSVDGAKIVVGGLQPSALSVAAQSALTLGASAVQPVALDAEIARAEAAEAALATGLSTVVNPFPRQEVAACATANVNISSPGTGIDGVTLNSADATLNRVLLVGQASGSENGIWQYNGATSAMTRTADADSSQELLGAYVFVTLGTTQGNSGWINETLAPITVGTTVQAWVRFQAPVPIPQFNTVAGNVTPSGVRSAGSSGLIADSGHIHPNPGHTRSAYLKPAGSLWETGERGFFVTQITPTSGQMIIQALPMTQGRTVSNVSFAVGATGFTAGTGAHMWFALYSDTLTLLRQSADDTNPTMTAQTIVTKALTSAYVTGYDGYYYIGLNIVPGSGGTMPTIRAKTGGIVQLMSVSPFLVATADSGLTTTAPTPAGSIAAMNQEIYGYVS